MEVRYAHSLAPRACGHVYTIMRGPLTVDGGFDTEKTSFFEPDGVKCSCADGGKRVPVDLHMLNPNEMAELGTDEKRGVEYVEVAIGMTKSDDDDESDGTPEIAEDLPYVEAKKPKAKPKRKKAQKAPEPQPAAVGPQTEPWRSGFPTFATETPDAPKEPAEKPEPEKPELPSSWPFGGPRDR